MFIDQLLTFLFFLFLLVLQIFSKLPVSVPNKSSFLNNPVIGLLYTYVFFYFTYILNYFVYICSFTKWISTNYSDAYWALYSSKLNTNLNTVTFKK